MSPLIHNVRFCNVAGPELPSEPLHTAPGITNGRMRPRGATLPNSTLLLAMKAK